MSDARGHQNVLRAIAFCFKIAVILFLLGQMARGKVDVGTQVASSVTRRKSPTPLQKMPKNVRDLAN